MSNINSKDNNGNTKLILASFKGDSDTVRRLLAQNADTTITNNFGADAEHYARINQDCECYGLLNGYTH